jgi:hypothetical protein
VCVSADNVSLTDTLTNEHDCELIFSPTGYTWTAPLPGMCYIGFEGGPVDESGTDPDGCEAISTLHTWVGPKNSACKNALQLPVVTESSNRSACEGYDVPTGNIWTPPISSECSDGHGELSAVNKLDCELYSLPVEVEFRVHGTRSSVNQQNTPTPRITKTNSTNQSRINSSTNRNVDDPAVPGTAFEAARGEASAAVLATLGDPAIGLVARVTGKYVPLTRSVYAALPNLTNASTLVPADVDVDISLNGQQFTTDKVQLNVVDLATSPTIQTVTPSSGSVEGGEPMYVTGRNFGRLENLACAMVIGNRSVAPLNATFLSAGRVRCITPALQEIVDEATLMSTSLLDAKLMVPRQCFLLFMSCSERTILPYDSTFSALIFIEWSRYRMTGCDGARPCSHTAARLQRTHGPMELGFGMQWLGRCPASQSTRGHQGRTCRQPESHSISFRIKCRVVMCSRLL